MLTDPHPARPGAGTDAGASTGTGAPEGRGEVGPTDAGARARTGRRGRPDKAILARRRAAAEAEALAWVTRHVRAGLQVFALAVDGRPIRLGDDVADALADRPTSAQGRRLRRLKAQRDGAEERVAAILAALTRDLADGSTRRRAAAALRCRAALNLLPPPGRRDDPHAEMRAILVEVARGAGDAAPDWEGVEARLKAAIERGGGMADGELPGTPNQASRPPRADDDARGLVADARARLDDGPLDHASRTRAEDALLAAESALARTPPNVVGARRLVARALAIGRG